MRGEGIATDEIIGACPVGKVTPEAIYLHVSALGMLPPSLAGTIGKAAAFASFSFAPTLIKVSRREQRISFLFYPSFDTDPHPALSLAVTVRLPEGSAVMRDYRKAANPPILHRKETFVGPHYPKRALFAALTAAEEREGLLTGTSRIGTRDGWNARLAERGLRCAGHRLVALPVRGELA